MPAINASKSSQVSIKRYTSVSEAIRDLYKIGRSLNMSLSAPRIKKPADIYESDLDDDVLKSVPQRALPGKPGKNAKVVVKNTKPTPTPNVVKKPTPKAAKKATIQEDDEEVTPTTQRGSKNKKAVDKAVEEVIDKEPNVPATVDKETKEFEDNAPTFNYTGKDLEPGQDAVPDDMDIGQSSKNNLNKWNDQLKDLFDKREKITNIINTLSHSFSSSFDDDEKSVSNAIVLAKNIQAKVKEEITDLRKKINNATHVVLPSNFKRLINAVSKGIEDMFKGKYKSLNVIYQGGENKNGNFQLTAFIALHQLQTEAGGNKSNIIPYYIVAVSLIGVTYFINPTLYRLPSNRDFSPGFRIENTKQAMRYIEEQMMFSGNLDSVATIGVPPTLTKIGLNAIKDVKDVTFTKTDIVITLKSGGNAKAVANEIYTIIYSALYSHDPDSAKKMKIQYEVINKDGAYLAIFKFVRPDKFTGRTLRNDEVDILRQMFTDEDISKIQYMLNSSVKSAQGKRKAAQ